LACHETAKKVLDFEKEKGYALSWRLAVQAVEETTPNPLAPLHHRVSRLNETFSLLQLIEKSSFQRRYLSVVEDKLESIMRPLAIDFHFL
jgi:hypothetical protein